MMVMKLVNVRLSDEDYAMVRALKAKGVRISDLVRAAIRTEHARISKAPLTPERIDRIYKELFEKYPDPPDYKPPNVNVHDRRDVQRYIRERLMRKHQRITRDSA